MRSQVAAILTAISPRLAIATRLPAIGLRAAPALDAENAIVGRRDGRIQGRFECEAKNLASLARIDDPIVPEAGRREVRTRLLLVPRLDFPSDLIEGRFVEVVALCGCALAANVGEYACCLLATHHRYAMRRPGE